MTDLPLLLDVDMFPGCCVVHSNPEEIRSVPNTSCRIYVALLLPIGLDITIENYIPGRLPIFPDATQWLRDWKG